MMQTVTTALTFRSEEGVHKVQAAGVGGPVTLFASTDEDAARAAEKAIRTAYSIGRRDKGTEVASVLRGILGL